MIGLLFFCAVFKTNLTSKMFCIHWVDAMCYVPTHVYDKHTHAKQFEGCAGGLGCSSMMPIYLSDIS